MKSSVVSALQKMVFDMTETEHVHASILLEKLPDKRFGSNEEVIGAMLSNFLA